MSPKNLTVINKTHNFLLKKLQDKRIFKIYKSFEKSLNINENFIVAVSGGPDSLALAFLSKIYSIQKSLKPKYFILNHNLRKSSFPEAKNVQQHLKKYSINLKILNWKGVKPKSNLQSIARNKRYGLLFKEAKKFNIRYLLLGHQLDDLFENFFIRIMRGSGLNGLVSLDKELKANDFNIMRPLLDFEKKNLIYISKNIFGSYAEDPFNEDDKFKRVRVRNFLKQLEREGFDRNKFLLTIKNLKFSNETIKFYTNKNLSENVIFLKKNKSSILKSGFFQNSDEVIFRSLGEIIKLVGKKYYLRRGKKIMNIVQLIKTKPYFKVTLGSCIIKKVYGTVIISKE